MHGERGACVTKGGMCGEGGPCMAGGHAWQRGVCGRGECVAGEGVCMAGGHAWHAHIPNTTRYGRSMRGRYASYWNAFLLNLFY